MPTQLLMICIPSLWPGTGLWYKQQQKGCRAKGCSLVEVMQHDGGDGTRWVGHEDGAIIAAHLQDRADEAADAERARASTPPVFVLWDNQGGCHTKSASEPCFATSWTLPTSGCQLPALACCLRRQARACPVEHAHPLLNPQPLQGVFPHLCEVGQCAHMVHVEV